MTVPYYKKRLAWEHEHDTTTVYIYALNEPGGGPRYVGQCLDPVKRLKDHWVSRAKKVHYNPALRDWLASLGEVPEMIILQQVERRHAFAAEKHWIELFNWMTDGKLLNVKHGIPRTEVRRSSLPWPWTAS